MDPVGCLWVGTLVTIRVSAMIFTAPVLGHRAVPFRLRLVLGGMLALLATPLVLARNTEPPAVDDWLPAASSELTIGLALGLGVSLVYYAAQMAGTVISQMAAIPLGEAAGSSAPEGPVGGLFGILSAAAFVLLGGPEWLVSATLGTFEYLPLGVSLRSESVIDLIVELLRQSFLLTLRGVGPAVAAMLASTLVIGLISRNYPQINLLNLGLTTNLTVMWLAIFFTVGGCIWLFADDLTTLLPTIGNSLESAAQTPGQSLPGGGGLAP